MADEGERFLGDEHPCPECGEPMLDDRDGLTGAPYFCANGHQAVYLTEPQGDELYGADDADA